MASTHIVAVILLAGFLPGAKADCWIDRYVQSINHISAASFRSTVITPVFPLSSPTLRNGNETCDGLSSLARALIGLAFCTYHRLSTRITILPRATPVPLHFILTLNFFPHPYSTQPVLVFLAILFGLFFYRRRRNNRANLAFIQQSQPGSGAAAYGGAGGPPPFPPQYPAPTHNGFNSPYNYDPSSGFAPVRGPFLILFSSLLSY